MVKGLPRPLRKRGEWLKLLIQILTDNLLRSILTGIIDDHADEREFGLLHAETIHRLCDVGRMVEGGAAYADLETRGER